MCGINGMVFMNNVERSEATWDAIRFIFDEALVETEDRGHHATGLTIQQRDGVDYGFYKSDLSASVMVTYDEKYEEVTRGIGPGTSSIIAHTRYYTKGKPENMLNNHPFDVGNIVGVHNGTVANDDYLFTKYKDSFARAGEVDSEIIYQLIHHYNKDSVTEAGLRKALEDTYLRGMFALAFMHKDQMNLVHIVKQERPMDFVFWEEAGVLLFNSDKKYIHAAFDKMRRAGRHFNFYESVTTKDIEVEKDTYTVLDANASTLEDMIAPAVKMKLVSSAVKTTYTYPTAASTTANTGKGVALGKRESITASDSIGRVIEGELDVVTGEIIIYSSSQELVAIDEAEENDALAGHFCAECGGRLEEHEIHAAYNNDAEAYENYYCSDCHQRALHSAFAG